MEHSLLSLLLRSASFSITLFRVRINTRVNTTSIHRGGLADDLVDLVEVVAEEDSAALAAVVPEEEVQVGDGNICVWKTRHAQQSVKAA